MYADNEGIWLGFSPWGLMYLHTGQNPLDKASSKITAFQEFSNVWIYNITSVTTGALWLSTWGKGACYLDYNNFVGNDISFREYRNSNCSATQPSDCHSVLDTESTP